VQPHIFVILVLDAGEWSASRPPLHTEKEPLVTVAQEAGWTQEQVWTQGREESVLLLETDLHLSACPAHGPVTIFIEPCWFF
jgi:hypothetical protein